MFYLDPKKHLGFSPEDTGTLSEEATQTITTAVKYNRDILDPANSTHVFRTDFAGALSNLSTNNLLFKYAWYKSRLLHSRDSFLRRMRLQIIGQNQNYSTNNISDEELLNANNLNVNPAPRPRKYKIYISVTTRGVYMFDRLNSLIAETTRANNMEQVLRKDTNHKLICAQPDADTFVYITNKWNEDDILKLFGLLPSLFPDFLPTPIDAESEAYQIFEALYHNNATPIIKLLMEDGAKIEEQKKEKILTALEEQLKRKTANAAEIASTHVKNQLQRVEQLYRDISIEEETLQTLRAQHLGLTLTPQTIDPGALNFIKNNRNLELLECNGYYSLWEVKTPITNYNVKDVEMYFKRAERNPLNSPDWFASLITNTFIEEKYKLLTTTQVQINWSDTTNWTISSDTNNCLGNPHLTHFNCAGAAKNAMKNAFATGDIVQAYSILIAACATITFTDSIVIERFAQDLKEKAYQCLIFQDTETGEIISAKTYKERFNAKNNTE